VDQLVVCLCVGGYPRDTQGSKNICGDWAITQKNHLGHSQNRIVIFPFGLPMHLTKIFWAKDVGI
jgi:hypothetical protein